jgi:hypothetical protein
MSILPDVRHIWIVASIKQRVGGDKLRPHPADWCIGEEAEDGGENTHSSPVGVRLVEG